MIRTRPDTLQRLSSGVEAALAHLAEREDIRTIFTLDRRHFSIIRLERNRALALLPGAP